MLYCVCKFMAFLLSKFFFRVRVFGVENIPQKGGFILASNHVSYLDPVVIGSVISRKLNYMAKQDLFLNHFVSWFLLQLGVFPVKRDSADFSGLKEAMRRVKNGSGLLLFPEGTRISDGIPVKPQPGIGFLAAKLGVPVVPAFIEGSQKALPKHSKFIKPIRISVYFGEQIFAERKLPYQDTASRIMENIRQLSYSLKN